MNWTDIEIKYLIDNYHDTKNEDLSEKLNRSKSSISTKANKLKIKKSKSHISKMVGIRNKKCGRDLSYTFVKKIASEYKCKSEFKLNDSSCYSHAYKKGFLDEICEHMIIQNYSKPQLICKFIFDYLFNLESSYNNRTIIKPYELDIYYSDIKLAIEYNGKYYHSNKDNTILKYKMCNKLGILLLVLNEDSRNYEQDIKNSIIDMLPKIFKHTGIIITRKDINSIVMNNDIYNRLYSHDTFLEISKKYSDVKSFRDSEPKVYLKMSRLGILQKYTFHMKRVYKKWNDISIKNEILKYTYLQDFIDNSKGCYLHIKRNKKSNLLDNLKYKRYK